MSPVIASVPLPISTPHCFFAETFGVFFSFSCFTEDFTTLSAFLTGLPIVKHLDFLSEYVDFHNEAVFIRDAIFSQILHPLVSYERVGLSGRHSNLLPAFVYKKINTIIS
jgi:hypothetical protein